MGRNINTKWARVGRYFATVRQWVWWAAKWGIVGLLALNLIRLMTAANGGAIA